MLKNAFFIIFFVLLTIVAGCVSNDPNHSVTSGDASGIVLAGQESPEIIGVLKSIKANDEVVLTIEGKDVIYRLSDTAKKQIEEIELSSEVIFTTFSIGDHKETIAKFILR